MHRKLERILGYLFDHPVVAGKRANIKKIHACIYCYNIQLSDRSMGWGEQIPIAFYLLHD